MPISDDPFSSAPERAVSPWGDRMRGLMMVVVGIAAILALVSFRLNEVGWSFIYEWKDRGLEPPQEGSTNYLSFVGLYAAAVMYLFFGAAAWLLCILWIRVGVFRIVHPGEPLSRLWIALGGMMVTACIALSSQDWALSDWHRDHQLLSAGGWIGHLLGYCSLKLALGGVATLAIALTAYTVFLIYFVGTTPLGAAKGILREFRDWRERRRLRIKNREEDRRRRQAEAYREAEARMAGEQSGQAFEALTPPEQKSAPEKKPQPVKKRTTGRRPGRTGDPLDDLMRPIEDAMMSGGAMPVSTGRFAAEPATLELDAAGALSGSLSAAKNPARIIDGQNASSRNALPRAEEKQPLPEPAVSPDEAGTYRLPGLELLHREQNAGVLTDADRISLQQTQQTIIDTLRSFGVEVAPGDITRGPTITRYEVYPTTGLRVSKITSLENDIARATKAERINILAPIPGKDTVGIEIANSRKVMVTLHELLDDASFRSPKKRIPVALGKDVYGRTVFGDLAAMPHLLVAGATGSGKSVCINSMITSMLYRFTPDELKLILVDPKVVEMQPYHKLPHLIVPVVTDPRKVIGALRWAVNEMEKRYRMFAEVGVRNFESFNARPKPEKEAQDSEENAMPPDYELADRIARELESQGENPEEIDDDDQLELPLDDNGELPERIPYVVIIIDELADLMMVVKEDLETYIARLTQKARAAGIHLIVATQTPRSEVLTGKIKANIPSRIAFQVSSALDSRIILDSAGAEKLVGKGDMLYLPPGSSKLERAQGAYIDDSEVEAVVEHCASQAGQHFHEEVQQAVESEHDEAGMKAGGIDAEDAELLQKCIEIVIVERKASTSFLQRRLRIGYGRAARMLELMEQRGIVSPADAGNRPREVLVE